MPHCAVPCRWQSDCPDSGVLKEAFSCAAPSCAVERCVGSHLNQGLQAATTLGGRIGAGKWRRRDAAARFHALHLRGMDTRRSASLVQQGLCALANRSLRGSFSIGRVIQ